jgi:hypothetical protein
MASRWPENVSWRLLLSKDLNNNVFNVKISGKRTFQAQEIAGAKG